MDEVVEVVVLVLAVALGAGLARRTGVAAPILLVGAGVAMSFVPGVPEYHLDPEVVLVVFLPPLLYGAAYDASLPALRANVRPIGLLSVGLVLWSTVLTGVVAWWALPDLPWAAAFCFGAIVAPPDAVAATAIARRMGLPRKVVAILEGESLLNDATALTSYQVARAAAVGGTFSVAGASWDLFVAAVGGVAVGVAAAWLVEQLHVRIDDPVSDVTLSLLAPFVAFVAAEQVHASGVLAVVITGLWVGHHAVRYRSAASRLEGRAVWRTLTFLLEGVVFALIGLQLRDVVDRLDGGEAGTIAAASVAVVAVVVAARFAWVFPSCYLARLLPSLRQRDPGPPWQAPFVLSWAGMRGVVSLAAALALPEGFPQRDVLVFLTVVVIGGTLVVQGLTLPAIIRRLGLTADDTRLDVMQAVRAQQSAAAAGLATLASLTGPDQDLPPGVVEALRGRLEQRRNAAWEQLGDQGRETPSRAYARLRRAMLASERATLIRLRDEGQLAEEVLVDLLRDLDLEEVLLLIDGADGR